VKLLLERGDVDPDLTDKAGRTPLSYAAEFGREGVVKLLLEHGDVNTDLSDNDGRTPLSYAAESESEGVVKLLLERGDANVDLADDGGRTTLSYAAESGSDGAVKLLLERGNVCPNSQDHDGQTPSSYAARHGYQSVLNLLANYGVPNRGSSGTSVQTRDSVGGETTLEKGGTNPLPLLSRMMSPPEQHISSYSPPSSLDLSRIGLLRNNLYRSNTLGQIIRTHPMPDPSPPLLSDPE
jgi:ankyrin repeat protein